MSPNLESDGQIPSNLDLFSSKPINIAFQQTNIVEYNPSNAVGTWPARFLITTGQSYLNLSHCYLQTTFSLFKKKLTKDENGKDITQLLPITKEDKVSFINGFGATAIKNLKVLFNGRQIYNSDDLYGYNAYFRRRLGIETSRNEEDLQLAGYFEDDEESQTSGVGFEKRRKFFENKGQFHAITQIDADIFHQKKLLLNNMRVDIEVTPQNMDFNLIIQDGNHYVASVTSHKLYVKQHNLFPVLDENLNKAMVDGAGDLVKYPYIRSLINSFFVAPGRHDFSVNLFTDFVPRRVFVDLVDAEAYKGSTKTSPFEFKSYNLDRIHVSVNNKIMPTYPYDLGRNDFARAFKDLADTTENTGLTYQKYLNHSCIFAFDFQHYHSDKSVDPLDMGTTALSLKFSSPVPVNGIQAIVYSEFDSMLMFDAARNLTTRLPV